MMDNINESKNFVNKVNFNSFSRQFLASITGKSRFEGVRKGLIKSVKDCKDMDDINLLKDDLSLGVKQLTQIINNKDTDDKTREELKYQVKWAKSEFIKLINDRAKELKNEKIVNESVINLLMEESLKYMPSDSPHFETIENAIAQIQEGNNVERNLDKIKIAICKEFNVRCEDLFLIDNNIRNYFFGACIIPTEKECYKIADNIIRGDERIKFEKCSSFIIHLDSKLIYDVDATPKEITAVLLHEIGHKAISSILKVELKENLINQSLEVGILPEKMKDKYIMYKTLLLTPILNIFVSSFTNIGLIKEIKSDNFATRCGYGAHLSSLIGKLMEIDKRNSLFRKDGNHKEDNKNLLKWTMGNIFDFRMRRNQIIKDLELENRSENLQGIKAILTSQIKRLKTLRIDSTGLNMVNSNQSPVSESFKSFVELKSKGYSQLEVDELEVEIGRIEYHEDKLYLVNRIHKDLTDARRKKEELNKKLSKSGSAYVKTQILEIEGFERKLNTLLEKIRKIKIIEKDFEIYVKYPEGYEG